MYSYETEKHAIFTEEGQRTFLAIRDQVQRCLDVSGVVMMYRALKGCTGSNWTHMACVDRLVELGEIVEISESGCAGQHRVFRSAKI